MGRIGCNIGEPDNWLDGEPAQPEWTRIAGTECFRSRDGKTILNPDGTTRPVLTEPRDYSNRAPDRAVGPEALQSVQALMRSIAEGEHATSAEPYTITISPGMHEAICTAMGVESFTLQELIAWAAK